MVYKNLENLSLVTKTLGYSDSENFFEYENLVNNKNLDFHWNKVLSIIKPDAYYIVDGAPFILFYSKIEDADFKTIWNAQVPFVFILKEDTIYVYNGKKIITSTKNLEQLERKTIEDIDSLSFSHWNLSNEFVLNEYREKLFGNQLNMSLLQNIEVLNKKLKQEFKVPFATKLVLRIIFICYLIDRGVNLGYGNFSNNIEDNKNEFIKILNNKNDLYDLFKYLKEKFNGNLFELGNEEMSHTLEPRVFQMLNYFISGSVDLGSGQASLFPLYDFNIISVELISNIYEILLGNEGRQKNKSFYTPSYLVDYVLSKTVEEKLIHNNSCKVFDPSCGSGIFLVKSYRKLVENRLKHDKFESIDNILVSELQNNIYGVDLSSEAIDVTIFSLYLTILDYKNPKNLENFKLPNLLNTNLFISNFFDENLKDKLSDINFDFIIGNPPWGSIKGQTKEISINFIFSISNYLNADTVCSLVVPSKLLYNHGNSYEDLRKFLLTKNLLKEILDLSPLRKEIFKNANAPAAILTYQKATKKMDKTLLNKFTHISLKPNIFFELFNILAIEKTDIKFIEQKLLFKNDWAWKPLLFGTSWDLDICFKLRNNFKTIFKVIEEKNNQNNKKIIYGTGLQKGKGVDSSLFIDKPFLDSRNGVSRFYIDKKKTTPFKYDNVHRIRNPNIYEGPYCLVKKGLDMNTLSLKSAYSEDNFLFQESIRAIKGYENDKIFLKAVTGLFNSSLSAYLNVLLGSSAGTEREQAFFQEILDFPFFKNETTINEVAALVDKLQIVYANPNMNNEITNLEKKLDDVILEDFDLKDNYFVDYMINIQVPMICKKKNQLGNEKVTYSQLTKYAKEFEKYFINSYSAYDYGIEINISKNLSNQFIAFELNINENSNKNYIQFSDKNNFEKEMITRFSNKSHTDSFFTIRDAIVFEDTSFYILKKNLFKNWHPAIAKRDLAEVIDKILTSKEEVY